MLPSGSVTFLFTDIEGSTGLWERDHEAMRVALERHDALLREAIEAAGGHVFKTVGDAFCAAFARATDGLKAAVAAQRALAAADWSVLGDAGPLRVRMGLHLGAAIQRHGDYFGPPVNRVARIQAAGHGGQVLLSAVTREAVEAAGLPVGIGLRDLGEHRLKDLRHSEHIAQVLVPDLPDVTRALRTAGELAARDRIQVQGAHADDAEQQGVATTVVSRSPEETLAAIEDVILRDAPGVVLTAEQVLAAARHPPRDWREWRLGRIAEWSQVRYRLDGRFVGLTLLVDQGEEAIQGRWQAKDERYTGLRDLLADVTDPAIVLLGPPGSGKSTLLRRLELDTAIDGVRGESDHRRVTFFVSLNGFPGAGEAPALADPRTWLAERWQARFPDMAPLADLLVEGRVTLLLDALNEMPAAGERDFRRLVQQWKSWLHHLMATQPGNRVIFSCRSLDYSQPLSTPDLRVPQVRIEPLTDEQVVRFLTHYSPSRWREVWASLDGSPQLEVLRSPYFLALLVEQVEATGEMPAGRAALFTGFVRQALRREVQRGNALFERGDVLDGQDLRRLSSWRWRGLYDLPERGRLLPKLAALAHAMQLARADGERSQVRIDLDDALDLIDDTAGEVIVAAGTALAVLDEDDAAGELMYFHQLVQEYFAARMLAAAPNPELVRCAWRVDAVRPTVDEVIDGLDPADPLPGLPQTGWEETTLLAAAMADDPAAFVGGVMSTNLALAGRCAAQPEVAGRLPGVLSAQLRQALAARSRDLEADLRDRIACGYALGELGDPRFERREGPFGPHLVPPLVAVPGGWYPIGDDEPIVTVEGSWSEHMPRHIVQLSPFQIGQFAATNAEWALFMAAGGYDDERWWDTAAGRSWRRGESTAAGVQSGVRAYLAYLRERPTIIDEMLASGQWDEALADRARRRLAMTDAELSAHLNELYPGGRYTEPRFWRDARFNRPALPVVGICWYEARAFTCWLGAQTGLPFRLPSEAEWEAAARGAEGRRFAYGDGFNRLKGNHVESHIRLPTPIGVMAAGDTPEGACDLSGNTMDWTSSAYCTDPGSAAGRYPYDASDGREDPDAGGDVHRVTRGGDWGNGQDNALAAARDGDHPGGFTTGRGLRVAVASPLG